MHIRIEVTENYSVAKAIAPLMNIWEFYCTDVPDDTWTAESVDRNMRNKTRGGYFVGALMVPTVNYCLAVGIEVDTRILDWIEECRWRAQGVVNMLQSMRKEKHKELQQACARGEPYNERALNQVDMDLHDAEQILESFKLDPEEYKGAEKVELPEELS